MCGWPSHREGRDGPLWLSRWPLLCPMRFIKLGLISLISIFFILFLISLLFPSQIRISRAVNLPSQRDSIFSLLKNEQRWHPAYTDTSMAKAIRGFARTNAAQTDSTFQYTLSAPGRKPVVNGWQVYGADAGDSLTLQWYMDFKLGWLPWQKFSSLLYEGTYGRMMEQGLANFRRRLTR